MNQERIKDWIRNKTSEFYVLCFVIIAATTCGIFYFIDSFKFKIPLGSDDVIAVWPIGRAIEESSLLNMPRLLLSGFLNEDHLSPFFNFIAYCLYSPNVDPTIIIGIAAKVFYILILILSVWITHYLWKDKRKTLVVFVLLIMNQALMLNNSTFLAFNIVVLISLVSFFILIKYFENYKNKYLFMLLFSSTFGSLTFETYFITFPFLLVYTACTVFKQPSFNLSKFIPLVKVCTILVMSITPYLLIHSYIFGTFLPSSRLSITGVDNFLKNILIVAAQMPNDWMFGIPRYLFKNFGIYHLIALTSFVLVFSYRFLYSEILSWIKISNSPQNLSLFISLFLTIPVTWYTGRYHIGMWTFLGIIFIMITANVIVNILNSATRSEIIKYFFIAGLIPLSLYSNATIRPHELTKELYQKETESSIAAYTAINSGADHLVVVKLRDAEQLMHPLAFWIGNKIYNNEPGLKFDENSGAMRIHNMLIEYYENKSEGTFEFYRKFIDHPIKGDPIVLFKSNNLFFRVLNDDSKNNLYRAAVIPEAKQDSFEINLPTKVSSLSNGVALKFELTLNNDIPKSIFVTYGGKSYELSSAQERKISFLTNDTALKNELRVVSSAQGNTNLIKLIEVYLDSEVKSDVTKSNAILAGPALTNLNARPCAIRIIARDAVTLNSEQIQVKINGTIESKSILQLNTLMPLQDFKSDLKLEYWLLDLNRVNVLQSKAILWNDLNEGGLIKVCL
jgi:hypothetical protein